MNEEHSPMDEERIAEEEDRSELPELDIPEFDIESLPSDARIVALIGSAGEPDAASSAVEAAASIGMSRDHVLMASLEGPRGALDELMGAGGGAGFNSVLRGAARIPEIAVRGTESSFVYLPHGDEPASAVELLLLPSLRSLSERLRGSGGTLLLYLPAELSQLVDEAEFVDGVVRLARQEEAAAPTEADDAAEAPAPAVPEPTTARLREAAARPPEPAEAPGPWRRHQSRRRFPVARVLVGLLIVISLPVGWWVLSQSLLSRAESAREPADGGGVQPISGTQMPADQSISRRDWDAAIAAADELQYSVLLASYASWQDAIDRRASLEEAGSRLYFIAPTPLGGALYYRVFAGATATSDSATVLMEELVQLGRKETVSEWDIRPVRLAFALGVYPTRVEAESFKDRLEQQRIPAYTVPVTAEGDSAFQVYAGGFESADAADALAAQLEDAGWQAQLVPRRGVER